MKNTSDNKIKRRGLMFIISAPSGTGKTTLAKLLVQKDLHIKHSISVTTRSRRSGEVDGVDYYFVGKEKFEDMIQGDMFLEYAEVFGNYYGTPKAQVEALLSAGEDVLFEIEWKGHRQLTAVARDDVASVFILPPSMEELIRRITNRNQDAESVVQRRIDEAGLDISHWHEYDYIIINKNIEETLRKITSILRAERLKKNRRLGLPDFVKQLLQQTLIAE